MSKWWTKKEDKILLESVQAAEVAGATLRSGFEVASNKLMNRTPIGCEQRYYMRLDGAAKKNYEFSQSMEEENENSNRKTWDHLEDTILASAVIGSVANGKSEASGFKLAITQLIDRNYNSAASRWKRALSIKPEIQEKIAFARELSQTQQKVEFVAETKPTLQLKKVTPNQDRENAIKFLETILDVVKNGGNQMEVDYLKHALEDSEAKNERLQKELTEIKNSYNQMNVQYTQILDIIQTGNAIISK